MEKGKKMVGFTDKKNWKLYQIGDLATFVGLTVAIVGYVIADISKRKECWYSSNNHFTDAAIETHHEYVRSNLE